MKVLIILVLCAIAVFGVVKVLGSTMAPADYEYTNTGIPDSHDLGKNAISVAGDTYPVWKEARPSSSLADRRKLRAGDIKPGETFLVLGHFQNGIPLWVHIRCKDRNLEGWVMSTPDEPFQAKRIQN